MARVFDIIPVSMHRLPARTETLLEDAPPLDSGQRAHLRAIRPKDGEEIELFDGRGRARAYRYSAAAKSVIAAGTVREEARSGADVTLFACVTKGSRWDWTIEKSAELGIRRLVPVISERTVVRLAPGERAAKGERWRKIAEEAARQSGAMWTMEVPDAVDFPDAVAMMRGMDVFAGVIGAEPSIIGAFGSAPRRPDRAYGIAIGPEGDFTDAEKAALAEVATGVSLGKTILRSETAAICATGILKALLEEIT